MLDHERHTPIRIFHSNPDEPVNMAEGGMATAANKVAKSGREGDSMIIHVNRDEFEQLRKDWGEPTINPDTGMPEFFNIGKLLKTIGGPAIGALAGAFAPVIGDTLGGWFPGMSSMLGETGMQALGSAGLGAGAGYLLDGGRGAALGGLGGIAGAYGADAFGFGSGADVAGATIAPAGGAALPGVAAEMAFNPNVASAGASKTGSVPFAAVLGALKMAGGAFSNDKAAKDAKKANKRAEAQFNTPMPEWNNTRSSTENWAVPDYTTGGEQSYFANNGFALGGLATAATTTPTTPELNRIYTPQIGVPDYTTGGEHNFFSYGPPASGTPVVPTTTSPPLVQPPSSAGTGMGFMARRNEQMAARQAANLARQEASGQRFETRFPQLAERRDAMAASREAARLARQSQPRPNFLNRSFEDGGPVRGATSDREKMDMMRRLVLSQIYGYPTVNQEGKGDRLDWMERQEGGGYPDTAYTPSPEEIEGYMANDLNSMYAEGGMASGEDGRSDGISAVLSDGEYVIDAETVALLGNGSSEAGANKLDQMREEIRRHKGGALSQGQISPDAQQPLDYIGALD